MPSLPPVPKFEDDSGILSSSLISSYLANPKGVFQKDTFDVGEINLSRQMSVLIATMITPR